jgi:hypothetical protein
VLALGKVDRWGVGLHVNGVVHAFVGPETAEGDHAIVDLAQVRQLLATDVGALVTIFAVPRLIDHQHSTLIGRWCWIVEQQLESLGLHLALIPGRFDSETLAVFALVEARLPPVVRY